MTSTDRPALLGGTAAVDSSRHVKWPVLGDRDRAAINAVLDRGVLSGPFAPEVTALQQEWADYVGARHCLATNSGTAALHVALAAAGIGPGDEVLVPAFTFVASALAVLHHNAIPVFVDVETETWGLDPALTEAAITPRTRAILPVHLHGTPCRIDELAALAERRGLLLIEDACQAHGATRHGRKVGSIAPMGAFSLQSSKNLACGEGGLFVTSSDELLERANRVRMFGENVRPGDGAGYRIDRALDGDRAYDSVTMGWMYRMTELQAALARSQLRRLDHWNENARRNAAVMSRTLGELPGVTPPRIPDGSTSIFHKYRLRFDATAVGVERPAREVRDLLVKALRAEGVDAVLWQTQPVPGQQLFRDQIGYGRRGDRGPGTPWDLGAPVDYRVEQFPVTLGLLDSSLCLFSHTYPIYPQPQELAAAYAEAFAKVWRALPELIAETGR